EIDDYISKAKEKSYRQVLDLGQKGVTVLMQTAIKSISSQKLVAVLSNAQMGVQDRPEDSQQQPTQAFRVDYQSPDSQDGRSPVNYLLPPDPELFDEKMISDDEASVDLKVKAGAAKGKSGGGGIVNQLKKSYSLSDLSDPNNGSDETDDVIVTDPRLVRRRKKDRSPHRSSSASSASVYFSEVDVTNIGVISGDRVSEVRSAEDISSGYSSGEGLYGAHHPLKLQSRESTSSQRTSSLTRSRSSRVTRSTVPKKSSTASD
ncbi:hypothetical protein GWI33_011352, partial [Rhynchophorus ferrugineus]